MSLAFLTFDLIADSLDGCRHAMALVEAHCKSDRNQLVFGKVLDQGTLGERGFMTFTVQYHTTNGRGSEWNIKDMLNRGCLRHHSFGALVCSPRQHRLKSKNYTHPCRAYP